MNKSLLKMKKELKGLAKCIRNGKSGRKPRLRTEDNRIDWNRLIRNKSTFRHLHIAYCVIRGRSRQEIEMPREDNLPNEYYINSIIETYNEEIIRIGEKRLIA